MSGLIEEIQRSASDESVSVSQLLRRVKIAASKLQLDELEAWVEHELSGYPDKAHLPTYRFIAGVPMAHHIFHGWRLLALGPDEKMNAAFQLNMFNGPVSEIEDRASERGQMIMTFPDFMEQVAVQTLRGVDKIGLSVDPGKFRAVLEAVRNRCLEWALKMEKAGITGEGLSFSMKEKRTAQQVTYNVSGPNARLNIDSIDYSINSVSQDVLNDVRRAVEESVTERETRSAMLAAVDAMSTAKDKPSLLKGYQTLMSSAGDHITVLTPFLPALAAFFGAS